MASIRSTIQEKGRVSALYQQTIGMLAHSAAKAEAEEVPIFFGEFMDVGIHGREYD